MAHMRYMVWADVAEAEGFRSVARLFRAISSAETIHARNHFKEFDGESKDFLCASVAVFGFGKTSQNLAGGIMGETYEITEMYPTYLKTAKGQNEKGAERSFHYALEGERTHLALFQKAKQSVDSGKGSLKMGPLHVCLVCGWTYEGDLPDKCPICGATRKKFQTFEETAVVNIG